MILVLNIYGAFCATESFVINGVVADSSDFGVQYDDDSANAEDYGCGNMRFSPYRDPADVVLEKYKISHEEYREVCDKLEAGLSFGYCGWCI